MLRYNRVVEKNKDGYEKGSVVLGGRKIQVCQNPYARTLNGRELLIHSYLMFQKEDPLNEGILERMLHGLSTRNYSYGLEPCGSDLKTKNISKSNISCRFIYLFLLVFFLFCSRQEFSKGMLNYKLGQIKTAHEKAGWPGSKTAKLLPKELPMGNLRSLHKKMKITGLPFACEERQ